MLVRLLKLLVSGVVYAHDRLEVVIASMMGRAVPGSCVFLNYHSITERTKAQFALQMETLKRLALPLGVLRPQKLEKGVCYAAVTFDDAFHSFAKFALPVLSQHGIPVILFVPTGYLGKKSAWFNYGDVNPVGEEVLSAEELRELAKMGNVAMGSHSVTHPNFAQLTVDEARQELRLSKGKLELVSEREITSFSFPYGSYDADDLKLAEEEGYNFLFSIAPERVVDEIKCGLIGRVSVQPSDWKIEFRLKVLGSYRWLVSASAWKRKWQKSLVSWPKAEAVHG